MLSAIESNVKRQGASELIACVVETLQVRIIPFVALLIVPLLGEHLSFILYIYLASLFSYLLYLYYQDV